MATEPFGGSGAEIPDELLGKERVKRASCVAVCEVIGPI